MHQPSRNAVIPHPLHDLQCFHIPIVKDPYSIGLVKVPRNSIRPSFDINHKVLYVNPGSPHALSITAHFKIPIFPLTPQPRLRNETSKIFFKNYVNEMIYFEKKFGISLISRHHPPNNLILWYLCHWILHRHLRRGYMEHLYSWINYSTIFRDTEKILLSYHNLIELLAVSIKEEGI